MARGFEEHQLPAWPEPEGNIRNIGFWLQKMLQTDDTQVGNCVPWVEVQIILCHSALLLLHQRFHDLTLNRKPTAKHIETDRVAEAAKEQVASSFLEATMFLISAMSGDGVMSDLSCRKAKPMCQSANACHGETAEPSCLMPLIPAASLTHNIPQKGLSRNSIKQSSIYTTFPFTVTQHICMYILSVDNRGLLWAFYQSSPCSHETKHHQSP